MGLFDVHAHLTHPDVFADVEGVIARARTAGLTTIVSNGLNPTDNAAVLDLSRRFDIVRPAFGFYPVDAVLVQMRAEGESFPHRSEAWTAEDGIRWVQEHADEAFAIGEIGLDGYWVQENLWPAQDEVFRQLVRIAMAADKAIIIHTRKRERRALELLDELGAPRVNWHCFGGRVTLAREIAGRGHFLSIPANARRSQSFTRMLETLPRERILLETDCPYLGPDRDARNEPANVVGTAQYAAELWRTNVADVERQVAENFEQLFGVVP